MNRLARHKLINTLLACAIFAAAMFYYAGRPITHDTAWFMYAARGMLAGGHLYIDYIDVNAPMAYFTMMPAALLSNLPGFSNEAALALSVLAYILAAYLLSAAVTRRMNLPMPQMIALNGGILFIMCFMPHAAFGQREHLLAVLMMPYALAAGFRAENRALPPWLAIACGISAGVAVSIKLPYAVVATVIEAAILVRQKTWKIGFTFDLLALAISVALINLICFALYPVYWTDILPSAMVLYGPYDNFRFLSDALLLQIPLFAVALIAGEYRGRGLLIGVRWMMVASVIGAFALFIAQRKGWPHHALPILIFIGVLCVLNLLDIDFKKPRKNIGGMIRAAIAIGAMLAAFFIAYIGSNDDPGMIKGVEDRVKQTDGSYYILSTGNYPAFPLALNRAYHWTSRYPQLIELPGLVEANLKGETSPYEAGFRATVLEDIKKGHPATIFLYVPTDAGMVDGVDTLQWLREDPEFEKEWKHYRRSGTTGPFAVFERTP